MSRPSRVLLTTTNKAAQNCTYKNDVNYSIEFNRLFLKPIGLWPKSVKASWRERILRRFLNALCSGLIGFLLVSCSLYTLLDVQDIAVKLKMVGPLSYSLMAIVKYCSLILQEGKIKLCIDHMETDWRIIRHDEDRRIMLDNANFGRRLVMICAAFIFGGVFFYQVVMPLTSQKIVVGNITFRPLAYPISKVLFDATRSPMNELMIPTHCLCGFVMNSITVGACGLAAVLVMHACGQLQVLGCWLQHLIDGRDGDRRSVDIRLADIIEQHVRVLSFISRMEDLLNMISLVEVMGCTVNMCFLGYYFITDWNSGEPIRSVTYTTLLVSFGFNIFIFCYIGELLAEQCKKVGESSYMMDWYRLRENKGLCVILLISMSECSIKLTAGKFIDLSLDSFSDVIKTSVAYLNMLRTVTQ